MSILRQSGESDASDSPPSLENTHSALGARSAASARSAMRCITSAATGLEAAHHVGAGPPACRRCVLALIHCQACGVVLQLLMPVDTYLVVGSPAVSAARAIHLQLEWRRARMLTALHLRGRRREDCIAEVVLGSIFHAQLYRRS